MKPFPRLLLALTALTLSALACQSLSGGQPADAQPTREALGGESSPATAAPVDPAPQTDGAAPSQPPAVSPSGAGIACIGLRAGGVSCLSDAGWQTYTSKNSNLPNDYVGAGALCPDGRILISHYDGLSLFDGQAWENINSGGNYSSADGVACAADGSLWVAHFEGVSRYAAGAWNTFPSTELASGDSANDLVYGVAAAPDGTVWAVTSRSVAAYDGSAWTVYQEGSGFYESVFFNSITVDSLGRPWAATGDGLYAFEDGSWSKVNRSEYDSPQAVTIDAGGQVWIASLSNGVSRYDGNAWGTYNVSSGNLSSNQANAIAADTLGRVWAGTTYGLTVFDGSNWQTLRMDNSDIGDNYAEFVVVSRDGPSLPATADKPRSGLTGSLNDASNQPMAGMRVEICVEPLASQFSGDTPCSDQPFLLSTTTDAGGVFTFSDVPAGYYVIVAETGDSWAQLTDEFGIGSERTLLPSGEPYDIGVLTLEP